MMNTLRRHQRCLLQCQSLAASSGLPADSCLQQAVVETNSVSRLSNQASTSGREQGPHSVPQPRLDCSRGFAASLAVSRGFSAQAAQEPPISASSNKPSASLPSKEIDKACWSCDHMVKRGGLVCHGCEKIQPVDSSLNYFEIFGLPEASFDVDVSKLEKRYKRLQWNLHPDKVTLRPPQEREFSSEQASLVNNAYSVLKSPLARANYLLMLKGIAAGEGFEGTIEDPELLMEVLEAREEVEATSDPQRLNELLRANHAQQSELEAKLSVAFKKSDTQAAVNLTTQLTYLVKLEHEIVNKL